MIKINENFIEEVSLQAKNSPRLRVNFNFHQNDSDLMHRMLNAIEPQSYIQPHKHELPDKAEAFFCLRGRILVVEYDDFGNILDHIVLDAGSGNFGCEIAPRSWHSIISLESGSVAYELKNGPYDPAVDKKFAPWAPPEGHTNAGNFNQKIIEKLGLL